MALEEGASVIFTSGFVAFVPPELETLVSGILGIFPGLLEVLVF